MRHKAAIGISEESDADVVVVSEETGQVSFVRGGVLTPVDNINTLKLLLGENSEKSASESPAENEKAEENPT